MKKILCCVLAVLFLVLGIGAVNYISAPKKAENAVAIYLSKKYNLKYDYDFCYFEKTYSKTTLKKSKYNVALSGSAKIVGERSVGFYAEVKITPFSNKTKIEKLTFHNKKVIK